MISPINESLVTEDPEQVYLPSPERIRRMSAVFRRGWSDSEMLKRSVSKPQQWKISPVSVCLDSAEYHDE